jgi:hypothetical protein
MKKQITISPEVASELGIKSRVLTVCNDPEVRTILTDSGQSLAYFNTLAILNDNNVLPCGVLGYNSLFYNDEEAQKSSCVKSEEICEIIGDTDRLEIMVYSSLAEMNNDLFDCSFTTKPKYEII